MTTAAVVSHPRVAAELGHLGEWLELHGIAHRRLIRDEVLPLDATAGSDLLIVMGSPWSVTEGTDAIAAEIALVRAWHDADRPLLGICFGGQILATALGGTVTRQPQPVSGWITPTTTIDPLARPWLVWHNDRFTVPDGADPLAQAHAPLAFRAGRSWGLQFHPEVDLGILERMATDLDAAPETSGPLISELAAAGADRRTDSLALFDHIAAEIGL